MKPGWLVVCAASAAIVFALAGQPAFAHHSATATYIHGQVVKIEGTLKEFVWRTPHSFMKVEAVDKNGEKQMWVIEGAAPQQLSEGGLTSSTLRAGDRVVVTGYPGRIAEDHRLLLQVIERPSDGFKYSGPAAQF
jgi:thiamine monophosphate kinase